MTIKNIVWQFKSLADVSTVSGTSFKSGERILSFLFKNEDGELTRADIREEEEDAFQASGPILGRWSQVAFDTNEDSKASKYQALQSIEEWFFSLYELERSETEKEIPIIKQLLALVLERKRILRLLGPVKGGRARRYLHLKSKREYKVPSLNLMTASTLKIVERLNVLL